MLQNPTYVDVILPLALPQLYTYSVPDEFAGLCFAGKRVIVQFGKKKFYSALIRKVHNQKPEAYDVKDISDILDNEPLISEKQFRFWDWMASYYLCTVGEIYKAALPSGLKLESESHVFYNTDFIETELLTEKEQIIITHVEKNKSLSIDEIVELTGIRNPLRYIKSLIDKNALYIEEKIKENYKPKTEKFVRLSESYCDNQKLQQLYNELEKRAPKQLNLLMYYISVNPPVMIFIDKINPASPLYIGESPAETLVKEKLPADNGLLKNELIEKSGSTSEALNALIKKGVFEMYEKGISRLDLSEMPLNKTVKLSADQQFAFDNIKQSFQEKDVVLFHGITSSGKTEIYIHLINEYLQQGKQVLYLLPEIALTTQIINRLKKIFGNKTGIYHSRFSDSERVEVWQNLSKTYNEFETDNKQYSIILGVRSSVFLPFKNLGLIIVDEEHENTYKQYDPAPRYHARDAAMVLAKMHGAKTLLGTATPAIETYFNAKYNKYGLVELNQRYLDIQLPEILVVDTKEALRKKQMSSFFSPTLLENIKKTLENKEQIILFQNRRGFSPLLMCKTCGWIPRCKNCDVSLTYHKFVNQLVCHYCGFAENVPSTCKACGDTSLNTKGFGTEKIEDEIAIFFPAAKSARLDLDSTRQKKAYQNIISDFENRRVDILIGTQMVTKGLDFDNVALVGIMDADTMLNFPDFRAFERSYQLMAQVSGRAGRKNKRGKVIIQTAQPKHEVIDYVKENNYQLMYLNELNIRHQFHYPPYYRLIMITLKHKNHETVDDASVWLANELRQIFKKRVLGPQDPLIARIQTYYLKNILVKIEKDKSAEQAKKLITNTIQQLKIQTNFSNLQIVLDVDPV